MDNNAFQIEKHLFKIPKSNDKDFPTNHSFNSCLHKWHIIILILFIMRFYTSFIPSFNIMLLCFLIRKCKLTGPSLNVLGLHIKEGEIVLQPYITKALLDFYIHNLKKKCNNLWALLTILFLFHSLYFPTQNYIVLFAYKGILVVVHYSYQCTSTTWTTSSITSTLIGHF